MTLPLGEPLEFLDETYSAKTRGIVLLYGENFIILTSTVFVSYTRVTVVQTDSRTDGRAIAYTRYSIYAVERKNGATLFSFAWHADAIVVLHVS